MEYSTEKPPPSSAPQPYNSPVTWSTDLCDCASDVSNCCITCWCPFITFGQIAEIVDQKSFSCVPSGALYCLIYSLTWCCCLYRLYSCFYRKKLRNQYTLVEDPCADCIVHCCCETCALCQEYRELKHHGFDMFLGWQGYIDTQLQLQGVTNLAPMTQEGMSRYVGSSSVLLE